jgi:hypothetical protein
VTRFSSSAFRFDITQCPALTALPSSQQEAFTLTLNVARSAALAPMDASQRMAMKRSSDSIAQILYAFRQFGAFSETSA